MTLNQLIQEVASHTTSTEQDIKNGLYVKQTGDIVDFVLCIDEYDIQNEDLLNQDITIPPYLVFWNLDGWAIEGLCTEEAFEERLKIVKQCLEVTEIVTVINGDVTLVRGIKKLIESGKFN